MVQTINNKPDIMQVFDKYVDREYLKIDSGFLFASQTIVRSDRLSEQKIWKINCHQMPDKVYINGKEFNLIPLFL